jgi:demethylmenaquinone methyltransferase / 2-methoxy-6-polyprenyl-1,4-benzoquinol methylase
MKRVSVKIFAGLAPSYERVLDYATLYQDRGWKNWVIRKMDLRGNELVLDVGSGTLLLEERMANLGCNIVALDLSPEMTWAGREKANKNVALLINGDAEHLPFADGSFDSAMSCYVPKYVDLKKFADELARVTKPGARVALYDFAKPSGPLAPFLEVYIQAGLRVVGLVLDMMKRREAFTFSNLPWIVGETVWDKRIEGLMQARGFESEAGERLTGGVVFAYCGKKAARSPG